MFYIVICAEQSLGNELAWQRMAHLSTSEHKRRCYMLGIAAHSSADIYLAASDLTPAAVPKANHC